MSDYKLVPVEPTAEMMATGGIEMGARDEDARTVWRAMISAAPAVYGNPVQGLPAMMKIEHHSPDIAIEKDIFGTVHIKVGDFDYIQIQYQYPNTDNARQLRHAMLIADVLAGTSPQPAEQQPAPDGWRLVPVEPTEDMLVDGQEEWAHRPHGSLEDCEEARLIYKAMIAAAPQPASAVQGEPVAVMYEDGSLLSKADCGDNFEICCKVQTPLYAAPQPAEQQSAPDASGLVVTLKSIEEWVMRYADPKHPVATVARKALADYRKQGGEA